MKNTSFAAAKRLAALVLAICLLASAVPALAAGSASITPSGVKTYVRLSSAVTLFTGETTGTGKIISAPAGSVLQLVNTATYKGSDNQVYACIYYNSIRYNVLYSQISASIMSAADLDTYITGTVWKQTTYSTLKKALNLVGDVRVHALQLALKNLGYYTGALDGNYGDATAAAVKKFQKAHGLNADGAAGALTLPVIYSAASGSSGSGSGSGGSSAPTSGSLKTLTSVNLRKSASTSSARLAVVPKGANLSYTATSVKSGITWFKVSYSGKTGWLMGTFVNAQANANTNPIATGTISKASTRVRTAPNGDKSGLVLAKGTKVSILADPVTAAGYSWYNIRTSTGKIGYVRGDCITVDGSGSGSGSGSGTSTAVVPTGSVTFVKLPAQTALFTTETYSTGAFLVNAGTVLRLNGTYTSGGTEYAQLYYNNTLYNALYSSVKSGIMTTTALAEHVKTIWASSLTSSLKSSLNLVGDIRVYALQCALKTLGYYTGALDGTYGTETVTAVSNFQRKNSLSVDGACGTKTWAKLQSALNSGSSGSGGSSVVVADFGTVKSVQKASWNYDDNGASLFPKGSYATVMDVVTGKVFRIYRWSGGNHADCVPATASDTKTMCDIVGFPYNSNHPTSAQLEKIKADGDSSTVTYTWPDYKASFGGTAKNIGSAWDRRAALLNVNGNVYCVSIYGFPHGFNGTDSFAKSKFPGGTYFYATNNFYGMMCIHFTGSKTHGGAAVDANHQKAIESAYTYAKSKWPTLCK